MPGVAENIRPAGRRLPVNEASPRKDPNSDRLASLARMTFEAQHSGLMLPRFNQAPTSVSHGTSDSTALQFAMEFAKAGLGSVEELYKSCASLSQFCQLALRDWLSTRWKPNSDGDLDLSLAFTNNFSFGSLEQGKVAFLIEANCARVVYLGPTVKAMAVEDAQLARDFYLAYSYLVRQWLSVYDLERAAQMHEWNLDHWHEEAECEHKTFESYLNEYGIAVVDPNDDVPQVLRSQESKLPVCDEIAALKAITRLKRCRSAEFREIVSMLIALWVNQPKRRDRPWDDTFSSEWEDDPLPALVMSFFSQDGIEQYFDDEARGFLESSHEPFWFRVFDVSQTAESLGEVERLITFCNRLSELNALLKD